jgi:hypothetical protein cdiviTM7_01500
MNPELPQVNSNPEVQPQNTGGGEYNVENTSLNPEVGREFEQSLGARVEQYNNIPVALPVDNTTTVPLSQSDAQSTSQPRVVADGDTPLVAADEDLIEREWVDKVKKIIALTKDNPYERNRVIAQLQADYLKKRYNKTLGQNDDGSK